MSANRGRGYRKEGKFFFCAICRTCIPDPENTESNGGDTCDICDMRDASEIIVQQILSLDSKQLIRVFDALAFDVGTSLRIESMLRLTKNLKKRENP